MITVDSLRRVEILSDLSDEQLASVAAICATKVFGSGDVVVREREPSDEIYIIHKGNAQVSVAGTLVAAQGPPDLEATSVISLGQGQIFGEMALIDMGPRSATVHCTSDGTELYVIRRSDFVELCDRNTDIGYKVMRNLAADLSFKLRHRNLSWR